MPLVVVRVVICVAGLAIASPGCTDEPPVGAVDWRISGARVHAIDRRPDGRPEGVVLFLHGGAYTSADWDRLGLLDDVVDAGWRAVAVDLPGRGDSEGTALDPAGFLDALVDQLGAPPVIVSPSASGAYSLPFVASYPGRLRGFVPVAPVGAAEFSMPAGAEPPPTLVVWGGEDDLFDPSIAEDLAAELGGTAAIVPGASHSPYEDETAAFRRLLVDFLDQRATASPTAATTRNGSASATPAAR